jgi:phosphohistidine phosphatase
MKIILVRHGQTLPNPEDGLSPEGIESVKKCHIPKPDAILCSPKKRARQTADLLAPGLPIIETSLLKPNAYPEETIAFIKEQTAETLLVVGHLPSLSLIASLLLLDNISLLINFGNAGTLTIDTTFSSPGILAIN